MSVLLRPDFPAPPLSEADIVTADLLINLRVLQLIAHRKAEQWPPAERDFGYQHELRALRLLAEAMIESRKAKREAESLTPHQHLIARLEHILECKRHGLGAPYDAKAVAHYEQLLADARAADPQSPDVYLADMLIAAE